MKSTPFLVLGMLAVLVAPLAPAQDQEAILKLKNQIIDLQNRGSLGFKDFTLCSKILGFGSFVALDRAEVGQGAELEIYYEPVNVYTNRGKGLYELFYTQDIVLLSEQGDTVYEAKELLNFHWVSKSPVFDLYATNSLNLGGLPPGNYTYKAVLHDKLKDAAAEYSLPFTVRP
jgi:hypothetical protein